MIDVVHMELSPNLAKAMELDPAEQLLYLAKYGFACFDCEAFGPPGLDDARNMREYVKRFAPFQFGNGDHGLWTDICRKDVGHKNKLARSVAKKSCTHEISSKPYLSAKHSEKTMICHSAHDLFLTRVAG
eukprot:g27803.t1